MARRSNSAVGDVPISERSFLTFWTIGREEEDNGDGLGSYPLVNADPMRGLEDELEATDVAMDGAIDGTYDLVLLTG